MKDSSLKVDLRNKCFNIKKNISEADFSKANKAVSEKILSSEFFDNADIILCYASSKYEIDTQSIIDASLVKSKRVFVPKCSKNFGYMDFYEIRSFDELKPGKFNILEPDNCEVKWTNKLGENKSVVCVVPCVCADKEGYRIGFGGGYYDRFLKDFKYLKVCLCLDELVFESVPHDENDVKCDIVLTQR